MCGDQLRRADPKWQPADALAIEGLVESARDLGIRMSGRIVMALVRSSLSTKEKMRLLARIGTRIDGLSADFHSDEAKATANAYCVQIVEAISQSESPHEVLGALSFLPPMTFARSIPRWALDRCSSQDECHRQAALVLHANTLAWTKTGEEVAREVLSLRGVYRYHLWELVDFIDAQGASDAHLESFVIALTEANEAGFNSNSRANLAALLVKLVERRPAVHSLPDPTARKPVN
jgi:hypothetical protein